MLERTRNLIENYICYHCSPDITIQSAYQHRALHAQVLSQGRTGNLDVEHMVADELLCRVFAYPLAHNPIPQTDDAQFLQVLLQAGLPQNLLHDAIYCGYFFPKHDCR